MYSGIDVFVLLCIPGFILAGNLMNRGGISDRIIRFCNALVGHIQGGLAQANIVASMIFAGTLTGLSVGRLFIAGAIPGVLLGIGLMIVAYFISKKRNYPRGEKVPRRLLLREFFGAFWALMLTVLILYGIVGGFFSPTEAVMVACLYAVVVGMFVYRDLSFRELPGLILGASITTASIIVLVGLANLFAWILTSEQIPQMVADFLLGITKNKFLIILMINLLLLFVGTFMETIAALLTLFPTLLAVALQVGIDPIHFSMIAVLNLMIGFTTPPVGVCLFVASSIGKISISRISRANMPFLAVSIFVLLLVSYIPALSTWLPNLLFSR